MLHLPLKGVNFTLLIFSQLFLHLRQPDVDVQVVQLLGAGFLIQHGIEDLQAKLLKLPVSQPLVHLSRLYLRILPCNIKRQ